MLELASGRGAPREVVVAETLLPLTSMGAQPEKVAVREEGVGRGDDPSVVGSLAADPTWPGGGAGRSAEASLDDFLAVDAAYALLQAGDSSGAAGAFRALTARFPGGPAPPAARVGLALALAAGRDIPGALEQFRLLGAESGSGGLASEQAVLGQALLLRQSGDPAQSRSMLEQMLGPGGRDVRALALLADAADAAGDRRGAVTALARLLDVDPDNPEALVSAGRLHLALREPAEAAHDFDAALQRRPTSGALLLESAGAHAAAGDWWSATDRLNQHAQIFGAGFESDVALGDVYRATERWGLANEFYEKALKLREGDPEVTARLADVRSHVAPRP
jgi:tetratricopeptide (TPR) repeat protein